MEGASSRLMVEEKQGRQSGRAPRRGSVHPGASGPLQTVSTPVLPRLFYGSSNQVNGFVQYKVPRSSHTEDYHYLNAIIKLVILCPTGPRH